MDETEYGATLHGEEGATSRRANGDFARLAKGDTLGRYVVVETLGAGGMGVVYMAYDPELDRCVAIKLLRPAHNLHDTSRGRGRLVREARALAQLQHANVITVHDVGEHEHQVFVAMEYIKGLTLRAWLDHCKRPWPQVVELLTRAGRGLHAAHAVTIVHRDFKPDNVMLEAAAPDEDIVRVVVMDFGLATPTGTQSSVSLELGVEQSGQSSLLTSLTRTGAVMGTPAYMAPEQHAGDATDARTDQFSFCLTLYEALYGQRPFAGQTLPALVAACTTGRIEPAPQGSGVPRWLREVVVRGLAVNPGDRWPSIADLLAALARDPTRRRRRAAAAALGVFALGAAYGASVLAERGRLARCRAVAGSIDEVWNEEARSRVHDGITQTGLGYAEATWTRLRPLLDDRARQWREHRYEVCARPRNVPPDLEPLQLECFESSRAVLSDQVEILAQADSVVVNRAIAVATTAMRSGRCVDPVHLRHRTPQRADPTSRAAVAELDRQLRRADILRSAGKYGDALTLAATNLTQARRLEAPRLVAAARYTHGRIFHAQGRFEDAERAFEEAFFGARGAGFDSLAASAARRLVGLVGHDLARFPQGKRWARHAEILMSAADVDEVARARLQFSRGLMEFSSGHYAAAEQRLTAALRTFEHKLGPRSIAAGECAMALSAVYDALGETDRAIENLGHIVEWAEEVFGADHPETAGAHNDLAAVQLGQLDFESAQAHLERAVEIYEAAGLPTKLGSPLDNLTLAYRQGGRLDDALRVSERAVQLRRDTLPDDHYLIGSALINRGQTLAMIGNGEAAIADFQAALEIYERALGPEHARVADAAYTLAVAVSKVGQHRRALALHLRGLRIRRETLPSDHANVAWAALGVAMEATAVGDYDAVVAHVQPLANAIDKAAKLPVPPRSGLLSFVGGALLERGDARAALPWFQRAVDLSRDPSQEQAVRAISDFGLARTLWELGQDRDRALVLARRALATNLKADGVEPEDLAFNQRWLDEHDR